MKPHIDNPVVKMRTHPAPHPYQPVTQEVSAPRGAESSFHYFFFTIFPYCQVTIISPKTCLVPLECCGSMRTSFLALDSAKTSYCSVAVISHKKSGHDTSSSQQKVKCINNQIRFGRGKGGFHTLVMGVMDRLKFNKEKVKIP